MNDYSGLDDSALLTLARKGDELAEDTLILRYRRTVLACTRPYFLAGGDSEDLLQEGMIGLLSAMREFDLDGASFRTYAQLCIRRRVISAARSASRLKHSPLNDSVSLDEILSDENRSDSPLAGRQFDRSPEDQLLDREREGDVIAAYARYLSLFENRILKYYLDGCSYREIARNCGRSEKSVDNAVQRIRKKLARHLSYGDFG